MEFFRRHLVLYMSKYDPPLLMMPRLHSDSARILFEVYMSQMDHSRMMSARSPYSLRRACVRAHQKLLGRPIK